MRILSLLLCICIISSCDRAIKEMHPDSYIPDNYYPNEKTADKNYPYFDRYIERSYPTYEVDVKSYAAAKERVHADLDKISRKQGFDNEWTVEGPGNLGGRVSAVAVHPTDENIIFLGYTTGGVYRTLDGGRNWTAVFDDKPFLAIGDVSFDPINPETVYVGTGDPIIGGVPHIGDGIYKSTDGGDTWTKMGLGEQRIISSIAIDKEDSNRLFVASLGMPFFRGSDSRGIFSSEDGGVTWEQSFSYSANTGFTEVLINPDQPNYIYGTAWDRVRSRAVNVLTGEGSNFYLSRDGGESWEKDLPGLPGGAHCKTGMAICDNQPQNVFVLYVTEDLTFGGIYKSEDYGETFTELPTSTLPADELMSTFGWFFGKLAVNPNDPDHIVVSGIELFETRDGGVNWFRGSPPWFFNEVHADCHEVIFSGDQIYLGTDGGAYKRDTTGGEFEWEDIEEIPTNLFYRVAHNPHQPELAFGGMQDNGTSGGNSNTRFWPRLFGGDGFQPVFNPDDRNHFFYEAQRGLLFYSVDGFNLEVGDLGIDGDRPWDMPYLMSQHSSEVMYAVTDKVYRCDDSRFPIWEPISDYLSFNATGLAESPINPGVIYASFSDGSVFMTESFGGDWSSVNAFLPDKYATSIKASPEFEQTAYITYSGYAEFDNQAYVFKTDNFGNTWSDITGNLPDIPVNDILIIPDNGDQILFIANDVGVYGTTDGGQTWDRVGVDMPLVIVNDLDFNPATNTLIAGTFGKSLMSYSLEGVVPPSSTKNLEVNLFSLSANLTSVRLLVDFNVERVDELGASIFDNSGRLISQPRLDGSDINVSHLDNGVYYLQIYNEEGQRETERFVKI